MKARECSHLRCLFFEINRKIHHLARLIQLLEADLVGVLSEASTAHVEAVLADQTVVVAADSAVNKQNKSR